MKEKEYLEKIQQIDELNIILNFYNDEYRIIKKIID